MTTNSSLSLNSSKNPTDSSSSFGAITKIQLKKSEELFNKIKHKKWNPTSSSWVFYVLSWVLLSLYTGKACPFVDKDFLFEGLLNSLLQQVTLAVFISIFPIYVLRLITTRLITTDNMFNWSGKKYILFESLFFMLWTVSLLGFGLYFGFLVESILKITVGSFMFGFFSVLNLYLLRHRYHMLNTTAMRQVLNIDKFISIRIKFIIMSSIVLLLVGIVTSLVSYKNFLWLVNNFEEISQNQQEGILSVFKEIIFIIGVFIGWMIVTTTTYSTNIKIIFVLFNKTIYSLFEEKFDNVELPILNDEFGVMGENINTISKEMKEKSIIKSTFGKFVNPKIADMILQSGTNLNDGGEFREIAILFSDIRGFTNTTHSKDARDVVNALNHYFTAMVKIVEKYNGMVDKFIGDALMGIFGYDDVKKGINNAVQAAYNMQEHLYRTHNDFKIGIGIGFGSAIIGLVGSPERLDFTAIGNVVNTAARLESATVVLKEDILIDDNAYEQLYSKLKKFSWKKHNIQVKGIPDPITCYGLKFNDNNYKN